VPGDPLWLLIVAGPGGVMVMGLRYLIESL
jgi:hypothetical protein